MIRSRLRQLAALVRDPSLYRFLRIRELTRGYLPAETYRRLYECARSAAEGVMIDIGPAQGGSTLALGLGILRSGKTASTVYSIEKGVGSDALRDRDNPEANGAVLRANVARYGLEGVCEVLIGGVEEVHERVDATRPVSLLFIDADGALDRDFGLFYNRLLPGAPIIIDDVADVINRHARENYLKWTEQRQMDEYVAGKGARSFGDLTPLGKEYTAFRFTRYFLQRGLIESDGRIGMTLFARKAGDGVFNPEVDGVALRQIRGEILARYYELNPSLAPLPE